MGVNGQFENISPKYIESFIHYIMRSSVTTLREKLVVIIDTIRMWGSMPGSVTTIAVSKLDNVKNLTINVDTDNSLISDALYDEFINAISTDEDSVLFCRTAY